MHIYCTVGSYALLSVCLSLDNKSNNSYKNPLARIENVTNKYMYCKLTKFRDRFNFANFAVAYGLRQ